MKIFKIIFALATMMTSVTALSLGQPGGTQPYLMLARRHYLNDVVKGTTEKMKITFSQRIHAVRNNRAAKIISIVRKITAVGPKSDRKMQHRMNRLAKFHN